MASNIDPTQPPEGNPTTQGVRSNFAEAKAEIDALQAFETTMKGSSIHDTTSTRSENTEYTNALGRPMFLRVETANVGSTGSTGILLTIDGVVFAQAGLNGIGTGNIAQSICMQIPAGSTWKYNLISSTVAKISEVY